jgi:hypothetical protein
MGYMMRNVPTVLEFVRCAKEIETIFIEWMSYIILICKEIVK